MKFGRRFAAIMMALVMLLGMVQTASAREFPEDQCVHLRTEWIYPEGEPANCQEEKPCELFCQDCRQIWGYTATGPCVPGKWVWDGEAPSNCLEEGLMNQLCDLCGYPMDERNEYGPHTPEEYITSSPTCTEPGHKEYKCAYCSEPMDGGGEIPKLGHDWGEWHEVKPATCTEDGKEERVCKRCGATESRPIPKHGHSMGPWYTVREANKDHAGLEERACEYTCDYKEQREIPFEGGDNYIAVRKSVSSTPANGSYYVEGERITYVITVENRTEGYLANVVYCDPLFGSPDLDYAVAHGERIEANTDDYVPVGYTVTAEDVANGQIVNQAHVTCYSEYEGRTVTIKSNTVTVPTGEGTLPGGNAPDGSEYDGTAAIDLELENAPASVNAAAGDKVTVQLSVTNIGNITLRADTYSMFYPNGEPDNLSNFSLWAPVNDDSTWDLFKPGSVMTTDLDIVVTEDDVAAGQIVRTFNHFAAPYYLIDENGAQTDIPLTLESANLPHSGIKALHPWAVSDTVEIVIPIGEAPADEYGFASLEKSIVSTPANGVNYVPGEAVTFHIRLVIPEGLTLTDVEITDPLKGSNEDSVLDILPAATSADNTEYTFDYIVTIEDAQRGYVENTAHAAFYDPEGDAWVTIDSNTVSAPCGYKYYFCDSYIEMARGGVEISKTVDSTPANGQYYVPGEYVSYILTVKNTGSLPLHEVTIRDDLHSSSDPVTVCPVILEPGQQFDGSFYYKVTEMDAVRGSVKNIANVVGYDPEGKAQVGFSNEVEVPVGMDGDFPFGVITGLEIVKEETSVPANGSCYTEGETISYRITYTNVGEMPIVETIIYDTLAEGDGEIAAAEMLDAGESRYCTFSHVVTAQDVEIGFVANGAVANYDDNGYIRSALSNIVVSDTDGDPNTTYAPGSGTVDLEQIVGEDYCRVQAVSRDGGSVAYEVHFCQKHARTHGAILTMANGAGEAGQQMVWEYAYALWQKDIDAMYEQLLAVCDDSARINVMNERAAHLAMVANTQFVLKIAEPGQPAETAHAVALLWQDKCIDLCCMMNTAPSAREDSIFAAERAQTAVEAAQRCSCTVAEESEGEVIFADRYCSVHSFTYEMTDLLLFTDDSAETWATVRSLWEIELSCAYNALYEAASEEGGAAYLAEYAVFMNWLKAYEQFVTMLYPNDPEIAAEMMVNVIMDRAMDVCARMK